MTTKQLYKSEMYNYTLLQLLECWICDFEHMFIDDFKIKYEHVLSDGYYLCSLKPRYDDFVEIDNEELHELLSTTIEKISQFSSYYNLLIVSEPDENNHFIVSLNHLREFNINNL